MRKRPMLLLACVYVLAILFAKYGHWYLLVLSFLILFYGLERLFRHRYYARLFTRGLCIVGVFGMAFFHTTAEMDRREYERATIHAGADILLQGKIYKKESKNDSILYYLKDCYAVCTTEYSAGSTQTIPCNKVILYLDADTHSIGEILLVQGKVNMFSTAANEGQFDLCAYYESQKIDYYMYTPKIIRAAGRRQWLSESIYQWKKSVHQVYLNFMKEPYGGVLSAMVLGEKSDFDADIKKLYQSSGISHITAISGMHLTLVGMTLYQFLRKRKLGYWFSFVCSFTVLFLYVQMSGGAVSTYRALGMMGLMMLAGAVGRHYDILNSLGLTVMILLWENPFWLENVGFQFSVAAILGIATVCSTITVECEDDRETSDSTTREEESDAGEKAAGRQGAGGNKWRRIRNKLFNRILSGMGIWLTTLPIVAHYYYEIPTYSVVLNLLILPFMKWMFGFGLVGGFVGLFFPQAAQILLLPSQWILQLYDLLAENFMKLPYAQVITGSPGIAKMIGYYLALFLFSGILFYFRTGYKKRIAGILLLVLLFFSKTKRSFEVDILDVGQGDGIFICTQTQDTIFIDGGSANVSQVGSNRILPFLKYKGISEIDYWFISHADTDHISELVEILESGYDISYLVVAAAAQEDTALEEIVALAGHYGTEVIWINAGDRLAFSKETITCLSPEADKNCDVQKSNTEKTEIDRNDLSLVLFYENEKFSGIFTGDISSEVELQLLEQFKLNRQIDFYKAAHHGSKYSNSEQFLEYLSPKIAVISCSSTNNYGHPSKEAISHIEKVNAELYCTMNTGQVKIYVDKEGECVVWTKNEVEPNLQN